MVTVREQLAPAGGVQAAQHAERAGGQTVEADFVGRHSQLYTLAVHLHLSANVLLLQLCRCECVYRLCNEPLLTNATFLYALPLVDKKRARHAGCTLLVTVWQTVPAPF